ncbi:hypothetical protein [Rheinheimera baltica]|uniref:hypothetical protein n=1 Tax=Rheinheimera baltica TaxID=67576 RepID=UPI00041DC8E2|nr:hypothetical protein [Rheinheimera baltica]
MPKIILKDAFYSPFSEEFADKSIEQSAEQIRAVIRQHTQSIGADRDYSYSDAGHHYLCSTMMDSVFSAGAIASGNLLESDALVSQSFTHAYECACWGYCLRYHFEHKPHQPLLAISILDINSMEMKYWSENEQWGKSGFGITTLFFEIQQEGDAADLLHTGVASGGNNIISFASFAKQVARKCQASTLSLPFFPESMSFPVRRSLKDVALLSDGHAHYGHAFGSDPWIAFINDHQQQDFADQNIVFGSLALRGYYCFADVSVAVNVHTRHF